MKTVNYNPSIIEVAFAQAIASLKDEIQHQIPGYTITHVDTHVQLDNPHLVFTQTAVVYDFHMGMSNGKVVYYKGTQRDFKRILPSYSAQMQTFAQSNELHYDHPQDLIRLVMQYNYLVNSANKTTR